jgi:hypothetical protein
MMQSNLGLDVGSIWRDIKTASGQLISQLPSDIKRVVVNDVTDKVQQVAAPVVSKIAQEKTARVVSKGNVVMYALGGVALGALVSGGGWQRRSIGGLVVGAAGTLVAFQMGLLYDKM